MELLTANKNNEIIKIFLENSDLSNKTKATYKRALKQFLLYLQANGIEEINRQALTNYKMFLMEQNYKNNTVNSYLTALKSLYKYLEIEDISPNITKHLKGAKQENNFKKDPLTIEQVKQLLNSIDTSTLQGSRDYAILNLMINTGLRTIEIARANIEDIQQNTGATVLYIQGKGETQKDKYVVLTTSVLIPILNYLNMRKETNEQAPLFTGVGNRSKGQRLTVESISRLIKTRLKAVGLNTHRLTAHSLRHTAITLSLLSGATLQETQQLARHKNINTTLIYSHNINRIENAPENKIANLLSE